MIINGHGEEALGFILSDDIEVQKILDGLRRREIGKVQFAFLHIGFLGSGSQDLMSLLDALIADERFIVDTLEEVLHRPSAEIAYVGVISFSHYSLWI
jgi:hypothetical protein